ncbi:MAG: GntR family transcriptional regulator [Spirochaetota bacterium]
MIESVVGDAKSPAGTPGMALGIEDIHLTLRRRILAEDYFPGQKLSENALAKEFGCSRTPVREALKRLENEGLTEVRPQSGTYVRGITTTEFTELMEVRAYLEALAFRLAAERAKPDALAEIAGIVSAMDATVATTPIDMQRYADLHYSFHFSIIELADNELLVKMFERLNLKASHMFLRSMNAEAAAQTQEEHHRILRQLSQHDAKGEKFVIEHLWKRRIR